jgi:seryl-tRNA synthetase
VLPGGRRRAQGFPYSSSPQAGEREEASMTLHEQIEATLDNHCIKYPFTARMEVDRKDLRALLNENKALRDKLAEIDRLETDLEIMSDNYRGALTDLEESKASEKALREQLQEAEAMEEHERKQAEGMAEKVAALREELRQLEWCDEQILGEVTIYCCPNCGAPRGHGHKDNCKLGKVLEETSNAGE